MLICCCYVVPDPLVCWWLTHLLQVQVLFFIPYLSLTTNAEKPIDSVYGMGKLMFIGIIGVVSWEIALISRYWTWLFVLVWFLSYFVTFPFLLALGALFERIGYYDTSQVSVSPPRLTYTAPFPLERSTSHQQAHMCLYPKCLDST